MSRKERKWHSNHEPTRNINKYLLFSGCPRSFFYLFFFLADLENV